MRHTENKRLPWQDLFTVVIDKMCKMTVKGVKSKSESTCKDSHFESTDFQVWSKMTLRIKRLISSFLEAGSEEFFDSYM